MNQDRMEEILYRFINLEVRSTLGSTFKQDASGSDKRYAFQRGIGIHYPAKSGTAQSPF